MTDNPHNHQPTKDRQLTIIRDANGVYMLNVLFSEFNQKLNEMLVKLTPGRLNMGMSRGKPGKPEKNGVEFKNVVSFRYYYYYFYS